MPSSNMPFLRLADDAKSIAGMNISGYEISIPYLVAKSADTPKVRPTVTMLPSIAPIMNITMSQNIPVPPGT